jgi:hypothetical protein
VVLREQRYRDPLTVELVAVMTWADTGADGTDYPHTGFRLKSVREQRQSLSYRVLAD